ncbi:MULTISPECIES: hypothetical protein [Clavibacter]|uniref:DoxX family membrane protein n=1 Tax=Clavibacter tessellarius TaxID=31965 RepID=A0A154UZ27_9MICO|nr:MULTISPECIES: hypothetical protein [Clavibacter]KZC94325.1 hypothetical protein AWH51_00135 [Clavibacter michiganensis subsp. tessellarius]MDA3806250.1 hypothetical protein [Clavibacter sp. CT19]
MIPFATAVVVAVAARILGLAVPALDAWPPAVAVGLAAGFALAASAHFVEPRRSGLVAIVPPHVPRAGLVVTVTGLLEAAGAVGLLIPPLRTAAAIGLALLLLAVFPANVRAARGVPHPAAPTTPLPLRTAIQAGFLLGCAVVALG